MNQIEKKDILRVGFPYETKLTNFDPANVQVAGQYALLENLFTPLLLVDVEGRLVPGAASKFYWVEDEIEFVIRDDLFDSKGQKITVDDAYFSLIRLLSLGSSTHGDLAQLLCKPNKPVTQKDGCEGIRIVDGKLRIKPRQKNFSVFENFSSIDFSVIPRRAVDPNNPKSIDLTITSGPYSVVTRNTDGSIHLEANQRHFLYSIEMPQKIIIVPTVDADKKGLDYFESGKVDFLSNLDQSDISERIDRYSESDIASLRQTMPVRLEMLVFTSKGLRLTPTKRWAIGSKIATLLAEQYKDKSGYQPTIQYFPDGGKGSLSGEALKTVEHARKAKSTEIIDGKGLVLGLFTRNYNKFTSIFQKEFPTLKIVNTKSLPAYDHNSSAPDYPDFYIVSMDTGYLERLPNVINTLKSGFFGSNEKERDKWLSAYLFSDDADERIRLLRELHLKSLIDPVIIPIVRTPYVSLIKRPWKANHSYFFPNSPLWQISKN